MQTYKFYNKQGKRMAIFGLIEGNTINIIVFPFLKSKKETVKNYRQILEYYNNWEVRPIPHKKYKMIGSDTEDFLRWCKSNYNVLNTIIIKGFIQKIEKHSRKIFRDSFIEIKYTNNK